MNEDWEGRHPLMIEGAAAIRSTRAIYIDPSFNFCKSRQYGEKLMSEIYNKLFTFFLLLFLTNC